MFNLIFIYSTALQLKKRNVIDIFSMETKNIF